MLPGRAAHHPVLATPGSRPALDLTIGRLRALCADTEQYAGRLDAATRRLCDGKTAAEINGLLAAAAAPAPDANPLPGTPFLVFGQLAEDVAFLRRLVRFGRERLIPILRAQGHRRWICPGAQTAPGPSLLCRLTERRIIPWHHVFRTLWPATHARIEADLAASPVTGVTFQAIITFRGVPSQGCMASVRNGSSSSAPR